ncbi:hypothetical protein JFT91_07065 [Pseudomonas sp. TH08]|uniref:hypothetical protein n=1 Tax=unclassified Pseudomonas TaxID=196821 RepID=UPI001913EFE5|nr:MULTISPECIES: hypothetical protein [unclassified Pseudomonas]MBK5526368.1 hypothetical protein [Pseudomonas sp. TH06]MBK5532367.1 hypothetical protein [Pseudomonas sp. TH08]
MQFGKWTLIYMALLLAPLSLATAASEAVNPIELEVRNKTSFPIYVFQGKWRAVVLPEDRFQAKDYKASALTISTSTPEAGFKFVTLSQEKGCKAQTCILITGN